MSIQNNTFKILKYLSQYENDTLVRRDEVCAQTKISEQNFNKAIAISFAFGFIHGSKPHIGITAKGRLFLEESEKK